MYISVSSELFSTTEYLPVIPSHLTLPLTVFPAAAAATCMSQRLSDYITLKQIQENIEFLRIPATEVFFSFQSCKSIPGQVINILPGN